MINYLTLKKIMIDTFALYRANVFYITVLIAAILGPYSFIVQRDSLPDIFILIIPLFLFGIMLVEVVSTGLVITGYIEREFFIWPEIKSGLRKVLPYTLITFLGTVGTFLGLSMFVIPGVIATLYFNIIKIDYLTSGSKLQVSFQNSIKMLKDGIFLKVLMIYILPTLLQFLLAMVINPFINPSTLEEDIYRLYPYMTIALIIIYPVSICFRTSIYFNIIKQRHLNSSNELV